MGWLHVLGVAGLPLDPFQVEACQALETGHGVLVAAPTGAGKTVVGEFAVHLAMATGRRASTRRRSRRSPTRSTPTSCDVTARNVGLLTGDSSINGEAPIVVMTTEVLRNMMYAASPTLWDSGTSSWTRSTTSPTGSVERCGRR